MAKRIVLYPFKLASESYSLLRDTLRKLHGEDNVLGALPDGKYSPKESDLIIGWGYSKLPIWAKKAETVGAMWLNKPSAIGTAVNKEAAFAQFCVANVTTPAFTSSAHLASAWVSKEIPVVQRKLIAGHQGKGASVAHCPQEFDPTAKLYTKLVQKKHEYRVHVFDGKVIDCHEKLLQGNDPLKWEICAGEDDPAWVWKRSGVIVPSAAIGESLKAVKALGLAFGGVDVITDAKGTAFVLEVNTAPWLGTINVKHYAKAILNAA